MKNVTVRELRSILGCNFKEATYLKTILNDKQLEILVNYKAKYTEEHQQEVKNFAWGQIKAAVESKITPMPNELNVKLDHVRLMIWTVQKIGSIDGAQEALTALKGMSK